MYRGKKRFSYYYIDDNEIGNIIKDRDIISTIENLRIPPAWKNVYINLSKTANRIVVGEDTMGRKQSIYNPIFILKNRKRRMCNIAELIIRELEDKGLNVEELKNILIK